MSLLDVFTGGKNQDAEAALRRAQEAYSGINAPTTEALTLPQLQQYVQAGIMTPAEMQSYLQNNNAYATENIDQAGTKAQVEALNQLSGVANAGAAGTPVEQAQQAQAIQAMDQAVGGQRGAIEQAAQARGTPGGLVQAALSNQTAGQEAQQGYMNSLQSQAQAYQQAVNAMSQGGQLGGQLQGQQNQQANTVSGAANAMQQFNAANQQNAAANNAQMKQQANEVNLQNAQNTSNQNTASNNARTQYNANVPNQVFQNQMQKAGGQANVAGAQAQNYTQQGQQNAGLWSGLIGAGATLAGGPLAGLAANQAMGGVSPRTGPTSSNYAAHGGVVSDHSGCYHDGGICMESGGMVPGHAKIPGDSLKNDTVVAHVSPGEAVIPRTAVQQHMPEVLSLMSGGSAPPPSSGPHPHDVASLLAAMKHLRGAA